MGERHKLPATRNSKTHHVVITDTVNGGEYDLYIRTGYYDDGELGEVFVNIGKMGSTLQSMLDGWAMLVSVMLQYGIPLEEFSNRFVNSNFPPQGPTSDGKLCTSVFDYVMQYLLQESKARAAPPA